MNYEKELQAHAPRVTDAKAFDSYNWLIKVIDSCENTLHVKMCDSMIDSFNSLHKRWDLTKKLISYLWDKHDKVLIDIP